MFIYVQHWVLLPFLLQLHYLQAFEEVFASLEVRLESCGEQTLAESPRTTEEDTLGRLHHLPGKVGFIDVDVIVFPDFRERLYAYGVFASGDIQIFRDLDSCPSRGTSIPK